MAVSSPNQNTPYVQTVLPSPAMFRSSRDRLAFSQHDATYNSSKTNGQPMFK